MGVLHVSAVIGKGDARCGRWNTWKLTSTFFTLRIIPYLSGQFKISKVLFRTILRVEKIFRP